MSEHDRSKWDDRYRDPTGAPRQPSPLITQLDPLLPRQGHALDVAGGAGRHALWLAQRGLQVTLIDISHVALQLAQRRAQQAGVSLRVLPLDIEQQPCPPGPWDLILAAHFLWRPLFPYSRRTLAPGGILVVLQPTRRNRQRHKKPPERFLLDDGELPTLAADLEILHYREGWLEEGRHDGLLVARRTDEPHRGDPGSPPTPLDSRAS